MLTPQRLGPPQFRPRVRQDGPHDGCSQNWFSPSIRVGRHRLGRGRGRPGGRVAAGADPGTAAWVRRLLQPPCAGWTHRRTDAGPGRDHTSAAGAAGDASGATQRRARRDGRLLPRAARDDAEPRRPAGPRGDLRQRLRRRQPVLPVARGHLHRPPAPPQRRPGQLLGRAAGGAGWLPGLRGQRRRRALLQRRGPGGGLPHGLRRQVPQRVRAAAGQRGYRVAPPLLPGWDDFDVVSGGGYQGWGFLQTQRVDDALELLAVPAARSRPRHRARGGQDVRRTGGRRHQHEPAAALPAQGRRRRAPVAAPRGAVRHPRAHAAVLPRGAALPAGPAGPSEPASAGRQLRPRRVRESLGHRPARVRRPGGRQRALPDRRRPVW